MNRDKAFTFPQGRFLNPDGMQHAHLTADRVLIGVLFHMLAETRVEAGIDGDGSQTLRRATCLLSGYERIASIARVCGADPPKHLMDAIGEAKRHLRDIEPLMARLVREKEPA